MTESRRAVGGANLSWDEFWAEAKRGRDAMEITACNCIGPQRGESACPCVLRQRQRQYFNTTAESSQQLAAYERKAVEQNDLVMSIMRHAARPMTPWEVWEMGGKGYWPITSVRRSMTVLEHCGALVKLETKKPGPYKRASYQWALPEVTP